MTLRILNFAKNSQQKAAIKPQPEQKTTLTPEEIAAIRYRNSILSKSQSKKLEQIYESFEPTGFGLLYNYFTVETGILAPEGCVIPSQDDFEKLFTTLGQDATGTKSGYLLKGYRRNNNKIPYWNISLQASPKNLFMNIYGAGSRAINGSVSGIGGTGLFATTTIITDETDPENPVNDFVKARFKYDSNDAELLITVAAPSGNYKYFTSVRCMIDPSHRFYSSWYPGMYISDIEGNKYGTIKIGTQIWLASNLIVKKFNNDQTIQSAYDEDFNAEESAYCYPNNAAANVGRSSQII